jgi:hypothetical protein
MVMQRAKKRLAREQLIAAALTDNTANVIAAAERVSGGENYGCTAHMAQLAVKDIIAQFPELPRIIASVRVRALAQLVCLMLITTLCRRWSPSFVAPASTLRP